MTLILSPNDSTWILLGWLGCCSSLLLFWGLLDAESRSFFQSVCVLGYCLFPLTIAALINVFVHTIFVRLPVIAVTYIWSAFGTIPPHPPLFLFIAPLALYGLIC